MNPAGEQRLHRAFQVSIILKGLHALVEILGGLFLAFVSTRAISDWVLHITQAELVNHPADLIAGSLRRWAERFSVSTKFFAAFYLISHGVVNMLLVVGLLREKYWAYPASFVVIGAFIAYQLYRFTLTHSTFLIALTIFDAIVLALIWNEYRNGLAAKQR
jgi:uncharacterized membrane protein